MAKGEVPGNQPEQPFVISFGPVTYIQKHESSIPSNITRLVLDREQLPREVPRLGSSIIEDFVIGQLDGGGSGVGIATAFTTDGMPAQIQTFLDTVQATSDRLNWDEIFTLDDARRAKTRVLEGMRALGMNEAQIAEVNKYDVEISEGAGSSSYSDTAVYTSRLQAVRRAMDYIEVFGDEVPLAHIIKSFMTATIGHELGHVVDKQITGIGTNHIPSDLAWMKNGKTHENRGERFAEYWGKVAIAEDPSCEQIRQKEWQIQMAKVTQVWDALAAYNGTHTDQTDLFEIFREIEKTMTDRASLDFFNARRSLYGSNEVESYALPYETDIILGAIQTGASLA